ncbi:glycosyltransferase family 2 protein [Gryllotalpicola ginsengisoli]|uniref:glycosyltransferase family 2 protein n=1 Tax=Gryllotalpicola ginsengisoli TaxID=444608 RepID=UPI0003B7A1D1|nr:glycosyltransferase [Gryllotalpicola ginsengisoli]
MTEAVDERPLFSVLVPVFNPPIEFLDEAIASVLRQSWGDWQLVLADDASTDPGVGDVLRRAAAADSRVTVVTLPENGGIVAASNAALEAATGEFVVLLDHDDALSAVALVRIAQELERHPEADYLYSDEDKLDERGEFVDPFFKPDWSPERMRNQMYTGHVSVLRTALVRELGGFRPGFDGAQDHDLVLRVTERARSIRHIPEILYHWRVHRSSTASSAEAKPYAWDAQVRAVAEHLQRTGRSGTAERGAWPGVVAIRRDLDALPRISVVIPTRGGSGTVWGEERVFVVEAVRSLLARTRHEDLEIVVVYDTSTPSEVLTELRAVARDKLVLVEYTKPFNFSEKCNVGALASTGEIIVLLNDDTEAASDRALEELCAPLEDPEVGMTGGQLYFEDDHIQHAGHYYQNRGYGHPFQNLSRGEPGDFAVLDVDREVSGVTAACAALRRSTYFEIGGLDELLSVNFNDVDLSYKVRRAGLKVLYANRARFYHFESRTREPVVLKWELDEVRRRWGIPGRDPYLPATDRHRSRRELAGV